MKKLKVLLPAFALFAGSVSGVAFADTSVGEAEYNSSCAACHGTGGKGQGTFTEFLKHGTPGLTTLSKKNGGVFPFERVYKIIDGRSEVKGHGTREMPIWGDQYTAESVKRHGPFFGQYYAEDAINARVLALIDYLHSVQEK